MSDKMSGSMKLFKEWQQDNLTVFVGLRNDIDNLTFLASRTGYEAGYQARQDEIDTLRDALKCAVRGMQPCDYGKHFAALDRIRGVAQDALMGADDESY